MISERWSTVPQEMPPGDFQSVLRMHLIDGYMTDEVYGGRGRNGNRTRFYRPVRDDCVLFHPRCASMAARGLCESGAHAEWALWNCAPACFACHELSYATRCRASLGNDALPGSGDLDGMFGRVAADPRLHARHGVRVVSRPPGGAWLLVLDRFLTPRECEGLRGVVEDLGQGWRRSKDAGDHQEGGKGGATALRRTSQGNWCVDGCHEHALSREVHRRIENVTGIPQANYEHLQMLRYEEGQYYGLHHDLNPVHLERPQGARLLTLFLYLNDVEGGGGTRFPDVVDPETGSPGYTSMPKAGKALLWASVLDEDPSAREDRTYHEALPVTKGVKYGVNVWIHQRDFKAHRSVECQ